VRGRVLLWAYWILMGGLVVFGLLFLGSPSRGRLVTLVVGYWLVAIYGVWACCFGGVAEVLAGASHAEEPRTYLRRLLARPRTPGDFRLLFLAGLVAASGVLCVVVLRLLVR
jgi:hypothetical protein